jgi:hypothetical protein
MRKPINIAALLVILALSSFMMLYLFSRFPLLTGIASIVVLATLWQAPGLQGRSIEVGDRGVKAGCHAAFKASS